MVLGEKGKEEYDPEEICNRNDTLQKYLNHQVETEIQALYALQALITKLEHPQGKSITLYSYISHNIIRFTGYRFFFSD